MKIVFASMNSDFDMKFHDFFNQDDVGIFNNTKSTPPKKFLKFFNFDFLNISMEKIVQ
jgi:hypothetical protein